MSMSFLRAIEKPFALSRKLWVSMNEEDNDIGMSPLHSVMISYNVILCVTSVIVALSALILLALGWPATAGATLLMVLGYSLIGSVILTGILPGIGDGFAMGLIFVAAGVITLAFDLVSLPFQGMASFAKFCHAKYQRQGIGVSVDTEPQMIEYTSAEIHQGNQVKSKAAGLPVDVQHSIARQKQK